VRRMFRVWMALLIVPTAGSALADEARVAVAANFAGPARRVQEMFSRATPNTLSLSVGSTGKFYAQIRSGAPFDVLLSADDETPQRLEREKLAVPGTRFTYAIGTLVLWSSAPDLVDAQGQVLKKAPFKRLAIANPRLAPYGAAAQQVLEKLELWSALQSRLVLGENIAQTLQFVASGNAELGFVALSQIEEGGKPSAGSHWRVPQALYDPIRQDAVLLAHGSSNPAARALLDFLRTPQAREAIRAAGYALP